MPEPLDLLFTPGTGILIDTNGIICRLYFPTMGEKDFQDAAKAQPWSEPVRSPPKRDQSEGKLQPAGGAYVSPEAVETSAHP